MFITVSFNLCLPRVRRIEVFNKKNEVVTFIYCLFFTVGLWRGDSKYSLFSAIRNVKNHDKWMIENISDIRAARKIGMAKGKAEGKAVYDTIRNEVEDLRRKRYSDYVEIKDLQAALRAIAKLG